jgi:hypothetical protein
MTNVTAKHQLARVIEMSNSVVEQPFWSTRSIKSFIGDHHGIRSAESTVVGGGRKGAAVDLSASARPSTENK